MINTSSTSSVATRTFFKEHHNNQCDVQWLMPMGGKRWSEGLMVWRQQHGSRGALKKEPREKRGCCESPKNGSGWRWEPREYETALEHFLNAANSQYVDIKIPIHKGLINPTFHTFMLIRGKRIIPTSGTVYRCAWRSLRWMVFAIRRWFLLLQVHSLELVVLN